MKKMRPLLNYFSPSRFGVKIRKKEIRSRCSSFQDNLIFGPKFMGYAANILLKEQYGLLQISSPSF
jgi:hypothetical protein